MKDVLSRFEDLCVKTNGSGSISRSVTGTWYASLTANLNSGNNSYKGEGRTSLIAFQNLLEQIHTSIRMNRKSIEDNLVKFDRVASRLSEV